MVINTTKVEYKLNQIKILKNYGRFDPL